MSRMRIIFFSRKSVYAGREKRWREILTDAAQPAVRSFWGVFLFSYFFQDEDNPTRPSRLLMYVLFIIANVLIYVKNKLFLLNRAFFKIKLKCLIKVLLF